MIRKISIPGQKVNPCFPAFYRLLQNPSDKTAHSRGQHMAVHQRHGIGRFVGMERIRVDGADKDYIKIAYAGSDSLYVPATQLDMVSKYIGSHGGGTEEGQREVLAGYGITEERLGVPVVTTVDTVYLGNCANGRPVWFDRAAYEADLIVPINRVKLHTDFVGPIQSGLCKMLVIGLGNHKGCSAVHEEAPEVFADAIEETARLILQKAPVGFGIAILENAYDKTYAVEAVPAEHLVEREKELVQIAKGNMPYIMLDEADVIVCGAIGKDISGAGFDPNILGRSSVLKQFVLHIPRYQRLVLCDVTPASHGNGIGVGLFDVITKKVAEQLDLESMYANAIACNCLGDASVPCTVDDEETAIRVALKCCRNIDRDHPRIIRIQNTLHLGEIEVSEALLDAVRADSRMSLIEN